MRARVRALEYSHSFYFILFCSLLPWNTPSNITATFMCFHFVSLCKFMRRSIWLIFRTRRIEFNASLVPLRASNKDETGPVRFINWIERHVAAESCHILLCALANGTSEEPFMPAPIGNRVRADWVQVETMPKIYLQWANVKCEWVLTLGESVWDVAIELNAESFRHRNGVRVGSSLPKSA